MVDIFELKRETRRIFSERRKSISEAGRVVFDEKLLLKTVSLEAYKKAETLLAYYPVKNEPNILPIVLRALKDGKKVAFPISKPDGFELDFRLIRGLDDLTEGMYSIPEPSADSEKYVNNEKTLCIVPGLAFDRKGKRIGYGKGYYDRFLGGFRGVSLGLCYADFLVDALVVEETDISLDIIITDKEEIFVNGK